VPVDGTEAQPSHGARERVEAAAHVDGLDGDEHADCRGQAQHERSARTSRTRVSSSKSPPSSSERSPTRTRYRASDRGVEAGTSTTSRGDGAIFADRERFIRHALSERPSNPRLRAYAPAVIPAAFAALNQRRASRSSSIFGCIARDPARTRHPRHPGVAERSRSQERLPLCTVHRILRRLSIG
jgi:hypothetical protein